MQNLKKKKKTYKLSVKMKVILSVLVLIFVGTVLVLYFAISNKIIENAMQGLEELAKHDKNAISQNLEHKWSEMSGVANILANKEILSFTELSRELNTQSRLFEDAALILLSTEGDAYSSVYTYNKADALLEYCSEEDDKFITWWDFTVSKGQTENAILMGKRIAPFTIGGKTFNYILCRMNPEDFEKELSIDLYDGEGFSSIIDYDGNFIIERTTGTKDEVKDNFFMTFLGGEITEGYSLNEIKQKIKDENDTEKFTVAFTNAYGEKQIVTYSHMDDIDGYFVMSVNRSVFEKQSTDLIRIIAILIGILIGGAVLIAFFLIRSHTQQKKLEYEKEYEDELAEAYTKAKQANNAKSVFLNNMSHDIRTPMNAIIGFANLAEMHIDNKEQVREYLEKILQASNHLLSLINDVLDMSRIESGKILIENKKENLADILHGLFSIIQSDIHAKKLGLFINTENVVNENIYCDKLRLNQVLLNLLSNAVKFTDPGGSITVKVVQKPSMREGYGTYEFSVKDTGIGMSDNFLLHIFEPFTRERTSTVSKIQGTGLGMSITKNIVDMQGGDIFVRSKQGQGTEFIVTLEFKIQTDVKEEKTVKGMEGRRALVVDDDINTCQSVAKMFRDYRLKSEWTMSGKEALARAKEAAELGDGFDIYIIDWYMPDINGFEIARQLRKAVGEEPAIVILTSYDWTDVEEEARDAGVTDFVSKPFFASDMRRLLMKIRDGKIDTEPKKIVSENEKFKGRRILLTEDNALNSEIATEILTEAGFVVDTAENGQIAINKLLGHPSKYYDLILMDIQMPIMDGYEATKAIRALEDKEKASIPIIAMTANSFKEDREAAYAVGMNAHLAKPVEIPRLLELLKKILN